jgi:arylsulfatase A-like enzyme
MGDGDASSPFFMSKSEASGLIYAIRNGLLILALVWPSWACTSEINDALSSPVRPNILLVVVDDMGFSDIEPFGSEIATPTLTRLAESGVVFTNFYAAPTCSPARAMLMSGMDNHIAGIGNMAETVADNQMGIPGYEGHLRLEVPTIAERLAEHGYRTVMAGKWHLGLKRELSPGARGFDQAFSFSFGGGSHYSDLLGPDIHRPRLLYRKNGKLNPDLEDDFYSSTSFTSEVIEGLEATAHTGKPFFAYLALTAPHWPLQLPKNHVNELAGLYDQGYDVLREARLAKQRKLGLFDGDDSVAPRPQGIPAWDELDEDSRRRSARVMEIYGGMIQLMDKELERLLAYLEDEGMAKNTVVIFISDNGADSWDAGHAPPAVRDHAATFDNSLENMGKPGSFTLFDRGWAWVSGTPFRGYKGSTFEGGIRVPAIISSATITEPGRLSQQTVSITDFAPTIMDLAGIDFDADEFTGRSITPLMRDEADAVRSGDDYLGVEIWGRRAIKVANWKAVRMPKPLGDDRWMLFDLDFDPGEQNNLASTHPEMLARLQQAWARYAEENNVVLPEGPFRILPPEPLPTE